MSPSRSLNEDIQQHYARSHLGTAILAALKKPVKGKFSIALSSRQEMLF